jgi:hypothetical protein
VNRLFAGVTILLVILMGGAGLYRWERSRIKNAYWDGFMEGSKVAQSLTEMRVAKVTEIYQTAINEAAADCAQSAAVRSALIAEMAADARQQRQFEHERMLEEVPKTIVLGRKCGQLETPWLHDCVR